MKGYGSVMNFDECMQYIATVRKKCGISMGLENMKRLLSLFDMPDASLKIIHVAGTNGKGSTSSFIAQILGEAGYTVGRYISPAVTGYCEKIQFVSCGKTEYISEKSVAKYITAIKDAVEVEAEDFHPSEFEIETLMSLLAFRDRGVDYVILECGMGGKNDATNAVTGKEMCVFTTIDYDHTKYLGETLEEITADKAGIMTPGCKTVSASQPPEGFYVLEEYSKKNSISIKYSQDILNCEYLLDGTKFFYRGHTYEIGLAGVFQPENAAVAIDAVTLLVNDIDYDVIKAGLKKTKWPARFEIMSKEPLVLYDGAHNPSGVKKLGESLEKLLHRDEYIRVGIMGAFADKDISGMARQLNGIFDEIHTVTAESGRAENADKLAELIKRECDITVMPHSDMNPSQVIRFIEGRRKTHGSAAGKKNAYIVFGSLSMYCGMNSNI